MKVAVIGAGVLGACVASGLARHGAEVTVLEAGSAGQGTSATSYGWVNSNSKQPHDYFELNLAGLRFHHEHTDHDAEWWRPAGNLEWATSPEDQTRLHERLDRLQGWGYPLRRLTRHEAGELEPEVDLPGGDTTFVLFPEEGFCYPSLLIAHHLQDAKDHGAHVLEHTPVERIEHTPAGVTLTVSGPHDLDLHPFDAAVCCVGRSTGNLLQHNGLTQIPMLGPKSYEERTLGYLGTTDPIAAGLRHLLTTPRLNVRPAGGGRVLLQALDLDPHAPLPDPEPDRSSIGAEMISRLNLTLGSCVEDIPCQVRLGRRSLPADGRTVAGFVDDASQVYAVATHSGITLGPLLGHLVAQEVTGAQVGMLHRFRPDRFLHPDTIPVVAAPRRAGEQ